MLEFYVDSLITIHFFNYHGGVIISDLMINGQIRDKEVRLIANDGDEYMFCECKWRNEKLDLPVLKSLMYKADVFRKNRGRTWFVLFSKSGFTDAVIEEAAKNNDVLLADLGKITE